MTPENLGLTYLSVGIFFGALGAIIVRYNGGLHFDILSALGVLSMNIAIIMWGFSLRYLDLTYAAFIWYAVDAVLLVLAGIFLFKEDMNLVKSISICVVIAGIIGLNFSSKASSRVPSAEEVLAKK